MTSNKAQKTAARQRMTETGEPYSVARKATEASAQGPDLNETPVGRYIREAEAAGVSAAELEALRAAFKEQQQSGHLRQAAEQARMRADQAEEAADEAEDRADEAQDWADEAQDPAAEAQDPAAEPDELDDEETAGRWHGPWSGMPRPPRPPRPPRLPRLPRLPG